MKYIPCKWCSLLFLLCSFSCFLFFFLFLSSFRPSFFFLPSFLPFAFFLLIFPSFFFLPYVVSSWGFFTGHLKVYCVPSAFSCLSVAALRLTALLYGDSTYKVTDGELRPSSNTVDLEFRSPQEGGPIMCCTCGFTRRYRIPCRHVLAVVKRESDASIAYRVYLQRSGPSIVLVDVVFLVFLHYLPPFVSLSLPSIILEPQSPFGDKPV